MDTQTFGNWFPVRTGERHTKRYGDDQGVIGIASLPHVGSVYPALEELPQGNVSRGGPGWIDLGLALRGAS